MWMSLCFVEMDRPSNPTEEAVESVNPREQELLASEPSESNVPNCPRKLR